MYKSIFIREIKNMNYKNTILVSVGISVLLFTMSLGQIFSIVPDTKGIGAIVNAINANAIYQAEFQSKLITYAFLIPGLLFFFYLGFPYLLSSYKTEKDTKNLFHLFITPLEVKNIVLTIAAFSTCLNLIPAVFVLVVNIIAFSVLGMNAVVNIGVLLGIILTFSIFIFSISFLVNTIFWVTNCSQIVYNICRVALLVGMCGIFLMMGQSVNFTALLSASTFGIVILLSVIFIVASNILSKAISKEKAFLND